MSKTIKGILLLSLSCLFMVLPSKASNDANEPETNEERILRLIKQYPPEIFEGSWCGKWDDIFNVCLDVTFNEGTGDYLAIYRWEEELGKPYETMELKGSRVNFNTVVFNGGFMLMSLLKAADDSEANKARVLGLFEERSRLAHMELSDS